MVWTVKESNLLTAIRKGSISEINQAIQNGAKVNAKDNDRWTPLMFACENKASKEVIELLIDKDADVNAKTNAGWTPLMLALRHKAPKEVIELLIAKDADVNAKTNAGQTPLMLALLYGAPKEVIELLKEAPFTALKADLAKSEQEKANLQQKIDELTAQIAYNNFLAKKKEKQRMTNLMLCKYRH